MSSVWEVRSRARADLHRYGIISSTKHSYQCSTNLKTFFRVKSRNCQYLGKTITHKADVWYVAVIYKDEFCHSIEI